MRFTIPIRLPSLANIRGWHRVMRLKMTQKQAVHWFMNQRRVPPIPPLPPLPVVVTITRSGPQRMDDDNLAAACKYVRDQIAAEIGTDDGSDLYTWRYQQRIGPYEVEIEIVERGK